MEQLEGTQKSPGIRTHLLFFFLIMTAISIYDGGTMVNRAIRLVPNLGALIYLIASRNTKSSIFLNLFLICQLLSAVVAFYYEISWLRETMLFLSFASYLLLGFAGLQEINRLKANWFLALYFVIGISITAYLLYELTEFSRQRFEEETVYIFMLVNNLGLLFMLISALLYVNEKPFKPAMIFLGIVVIFILSEITRAASYYSEERIELFFYGCRILYVLSLTFLLWYAFVRAKLSSDN